MTKRTPRAGWLVVLLAAIAAGCGGGSAGSGDDILLTADKADVASAQLALAEAAGGDMLAASNTLVDRLAAAATDGASSGWISGQVDTAEDAAADCPACFTRLESVR